MLSERLGKVLEESGLKHAEFADAASIDIDRLKNLLRGRVLRLRTDEAQAIQQRFGWREAWLLSGKGAPRLTKDEQVLLCDNGAPLPALARATKMLAQYTDLPRSASDFVQKAMVAFAKKDEAAFEEALLSNIDHLTGSATENMVLSEDYIEVPRYDVTASAGGGAVIHDEAVVDHLAFKREWVVRYMGLDPKHLALITIRGDSMSGTIDDGDLVLLDTRPGLDYADGIYVIQFAGALLCKRLHYSLTGVVEVISDNSAYPTEKLGLEALEQLTIVGRVVWQGRRL